MVWFFLAIWRNITWQWCHHGFSFQSNCSRLRKLLMLASRCAKFHKNLWQEFCSLLRRGSRWVSHQNKIIEKIESARGTMGRGKPRALSFSFSPASPPPTTQRGLCGGEREFWDIVQFLHEGYNLRVNWMLDYPSKFTNSWKVFPPQFFN